MCVCVCEFVYVSLPMRRNTENAASYGRCIEDLESEVACQANAEMITGIESISGGPSAESESTINPMKADSIEHSQHPRFETNSVVLSEAEPTGIEGRNGCIRRRPLLRLLVVPAFLGTLTLLAKLSGAVDYLDRDHVRQFVADAGILGWLAYVVMFAVGELLHVPGLVFVAVAVFSFGIFAGALLAYIGSLISVACGFLVARSLSGGVTLEMLTV